MYSIIHILTDEQNILYLNLCFKHFKGYLCLIRFIENTAWNMNKDEIVILIECEPPL